jgi:hypothetical protein
VRVAAERLTLSLFQHHRIATWDNVVAMNINHDSFLRDTQFTNGMLAPPPCPVAGGDEFGPFAMMPTPVQSPLEWTYSSNALGLARRQALGAQIWTARSTKVRCDSAPMLKN